MILLDRYELVKAYGDHCITVGFGSYGQVKLAIDRKTNRNVAVKIVNKLAKNQVIFHQELCHPNVIKLLAYQLDPQLQITYMVLEYADGGTLFQKIRHEKLNKSQIKSYYRDICEGIAYLHEKQIMHRDIKPENILLTTKGKAKVCDFGFAAHLEERKTLCGTYEYMSPEMVQNKPYDYKIDIWALGILLFELISGQAPFKGNSPDEVLSQMKTQIFFSQRFIPEEIDLIKSILRVTPSKRPSIKQILEHPYFNHEDSVSTTNSEVTNKFNKQIKDYTNKNILLHHPHLSKPIQQNSYPFYIPKSKQVEERNGSKSPVNGPTKNNLNTSFAPKSRPQILQQIPEFLHHQNHSLNHPHPSHPPHQPHPSHPPHHFFENKNQARHS